MIFFIMWVIVPTFSRMALADALVNSVSRLVPLYSLLDYRTVFALRAMHDAAEKK